MLIKEGPGDVAISPQSNPDRSVHASLLVASCVGFACVVHVFCCACCTAGAKYLAAVCNSTDMKDVLPSLASSFS